MDIKVFFFLTREKKKQDSSDGFSDGIIRSFIKVWYKWNINVKNRYGKDTKKKEKRKQEE